MDERINCYLSFHGEGWDVPVRLYTCKELRLVVGDTVVCAVGWFLCI